MTAPPARERLARRRRVRRALFWLAAGAAIVLAVLLIRCRGGFGLGGGGGRGLVGRGSGSAGAAAPAPHCVVRVDAGGVLLAGRPATVAEVVAACRAAGGADVTVTGDARQGTWVELEAALAAAAVAFDVRGGGAPATPDAGAPPAP